MAIQYQWQVSTDNGTTFNDIASDTTSISGTKTSKLIVKNLTTQNHKYQYRVRVSDTDLTVPPVVSRPAILYAAPTVIFLPDPTDQTTSNGSASFSGQASVDRGEILSYQWQRRSSSSASFINLTDVAGSVTGSKTNALSLAGLTSTNNGNQYRLVVTAQCCGTGPISYASSVAQLNVLGATQSLWISTQPVNTDIGANNSVTLNFNAKIDNVPVTDPPPTLNVVWQEVGANGSVTDLSVTGSTSFNRSNTTITYNHSITIPNTSIGKNYRALVSGGGSSIITSIASVLQGATPCSSCGGSGTGDPHYYFGIRTAEAGQFGWYQAGFDDNKDDGNGSRELLMFYIRDKNTNIEYVISTKNAGAFGSRAPFNVGRTSARAYKDGVLIGNIINDSKFDAMGIIKLNPSYGRFAFEWSILSPDNINKIPNLNIEMGGAWYWMMKSYIQYTKKNPQFMNLGWPWIAFIRGDGIGIGLAPYKLKREDFELNTNDTVAGDPADISRLRLIINETTVDDMTQNVKFWSDLSSVLQGKTTGGSSQVIFTESPKDTIAINGTASFTAKLSDNSKPIWQKSIDSGKTWDLIQDLTDNTIYINVERNDNGNLYRALSNDRSAISTSAKLVVPQTIVIAKEPTTQKSNNLSVTFSVVASGVPPLVYQWEKSDDGGLNYEAVSKAALPILQLDNLTINDDGDLYRVSIQDGAGDLYVSGGAKLIIDPIVTVVGHPQNAIADNDEQATFSVQASCDNGGIQYRWQLSENNGQSYINVGSLDSGNSILNLSGLKISDNNKKYRAQIVTDLKSNVFYSNPATLTVPGSITVNSWPTNQLSVSGQATFMVSATSTQPPLTYQWQTSEPDLSPPIFTNIIDATGDVYVATGLSLADDNRAYRVVLEDQRGPIVSPIVFVDTTPQITIVQQPSGYIPYNYNLFLATDATTTNGVIEYSWQKAEPQTNIFNTILNEDTRILDIPVVPTDSGSQYRAKLSVIGARDLYTNIVKIDVPPSITLSSKLQKATKISFPNKNITLSVDATSVQPPLTYQWQKSTPTKTSITYSYDKNDIFYDYTQLLLEMNGDNGLKIIQDSSKNNLSSELYVNNAINSSLANIAISTTVSKVGASSLRIGERGCLRITDQSGLLEFGSKDFTIECWCYPTGYAEMAIVSRRLGDRHPNYGSEGWVLSMNRFRAKLGSTWNDNWITDNLDNIPLNEWSHIALTRRSNTYKLFRNGNLIQSFINDNILDETSGSLNVGIAKSDNHESQFNGYLDQFRITIGLARYVNNFNPEFVVDKDYDAYYNSPVFDNIPMATGAVLSLTDLGDINNYERYRVILTDNVSTVVVEDDT